MIGGRPGKIVVSTLQILAVQYNYTSNDRHYFSLSTDICYPKNIYVKLKYCLRKRIFMDFIFQSSIISQLILYLTI